LAKAFIEQISHRPSPEYNIPAAGILVSKYFRKSIDSSWKITSRDSSLQLFWIMTRLRSEQYATLHVIWHLVTEGPGRTICLLIQVTKLSEKALQTYVDIEKNYRWRIMISWKYDILIKCLPQSFNTNFLNVADFVLKNNRPINVTDYNHIRYCDVLPKKPAYSEARC
jgi:hypothetical protein